MEKDTMIVDTLRFLGKVKEFHERKDVSTSEIISLEEELETLEVEAGSIGPLTEDDPHLQWLVPMIEREMETW